MIDDVTAERFWAKVDKRGPGECWPWIAATDSEGYGAFKVGGKMSVATRVMWFIDTGSPPLSLLVCHTCDNPPCVNPAHLFLGTRIDNAQDSVRKGRTRGQRMTHCFRGHPFSPDNTYFYRGKRGCRSCRHIATIAYKRRKEAA